jgi:hypothetical protein
MPLAPLPEARRNLDTVIRPDGELLTVEDTAGDHGGRLWEALLDDAQSTRVEPEAS